MPTNGHRADTILNVVADRRIMGALRGGRRGRIEFAYDEQWRSADAAYPLSLSMPLDSVHHRGDKLESWLWGLLPDDPVVLGRWGMRFQVSPTDILGLLGAVGEDCPGAIQVVRRERAEAILEEPDRPVEWLTETDVAERLRILRTDPAAWRLTRDSSYFSLAGAQPKTALLFDGQRWGLPGGRTPTTHILKPPRPALYGHAENEHLCLALARRMGLPAARSQVTRFEDETAIVVERYDRPRVGDGFHRLHQEDMCQVLGIRPMQKYETQGGPGCSDMIGAIRAHSGEPYEDALTFVRAIMLNWIIGGTDAHAKNFSMLIGAGGRARLAPLYDMASALPYGADRGTLRMATAIGGDYVLESLSARNWAVFASEARIPFSEVIDAGRAMADALPRVFAGIVGEARAGGLDHPIIGRMTDALNARSADCFRILDPSAH